ncbi:gamma-tubulin complex component 2 [Cryptococcus neoformans var. grubii Br795]|uniref:Spindle pole body component n=1 Tax=Cryptococcus neoformans Tu259-1 TaxID=1230072 RepID=A0A854QMW4_CRYNE|nr:gamma-tubulin complex component 2 [Cryptococcus neoformans var. grubii 125.91]OWZ59013.1 gamma-tubulin complex component 2 [Cryptococcus neoformans var. grubii AD1-83a]OXG29869.1 gamma-tubulin complex component 2 [Cryptococcus neoformans var. grubii Tu259-1]OXG41655.1 gamma-tubulin complex component 2 [Cryptococcus neoformans var. grubii Bt120]OXG54945.1 gamma-tubulin complex component 2 [Cryptococcus neoformans var. grubii Th84]OXG69539.1 gamma-tubulin complex component 2 [Cryptococcus neo
MSSSRPATSSTVPFTPKPRKRTSSSRFTFTDKELNQFAGTLASVRKIRPGAILEELEQSGEGSGILHRHESYLHRGNPEDQKRPASARAMENERDRSHFRTRPSSSASIAQREYNPSSFLRAMSGSRDILPDSDHRGREKIKEPAKSEPLVEHPTLVTELSAEKRLLDEVPLEVQEAWICEDLLFVLQGVEGVLIRYDEGYDPFDEEQRIKGAKWRVNPLLDSSLLSLVKRLLPLASFFTAVEASMELRTAPEYGMVSHALCSGIRAMLKEFRVLTAQLESLFLSSPTFTLQTLYLHLHPTLHTMSLLASLCHALEADQAGQGTDDLSDDDDDGLGGMAEELGLGGAGLKGLMKNLKAQEGLIGDGGDVLGGEVLGIICEREANMSGDPTASTLHSSLLLHASQPYCKMLIQWIATGHLSDPFDEFMVKESGHITKGVLESDYTDEYWERRYTLRDGAIPGSSKVSARNSTPSISAGVPPPRQGTNRLPGGACIPQFLQPWKHKILLAGKYLNVIRECGIEVKKPGEVDEKEMVTMNDPNFYKRIEDAYIYANKTLLKLMVEEQELIPHLRSMKHFFFLNQSDFLTNFLDLAASELRKPAKSASIVKLQSLLDLAVRNPSSSSSNDPYKDDLKVLMQSQGLYDWLLKIVSKTGSLTEEGELDFALGDMHEEEGSKREKERPLIAIDALAFDYSVKFPLSLIISRKTIARYQLIFRFLLHLHHLESALSAMWLEHKSPSWRDNSGNEDIERWKARIFSLRTRMLAFVRQVLAFATGEVLEPNWKALEEKLAKVQTVDQLLRDHVDFLDTCLKQCMLTTSKLLNIYAKLMTTISVFVSYQSSLNSALNKFLMDPIAESDPAKSKLRWTALSKFEINFNHHAKLHLDAVTYNAGSENVALLALVTRLHQITLRI